MSKPKAPQYPNEGARRLDFYFEQDYALQRGTLAEKIGMNPQNLAPILRGERHPTMTQAAALADLTGIPMRTWTEPAAS